MDYIAGLLELLGVWSVGNKNRQGFLLCLLCNVMWIVVAMNSGVYGLIPVSLCMAVLNTRNYRKWGRTQTTEYQHER